MEASADRIRSVVKNLLPERPHHLSLYPDRKYQAPPNFWQHIHHSPLQYSTFLSDADRGVLLTRPYFDICEEPESSPAKPPPAARAGLKKTLNKMSFKDYKRQKEKASTPPTENAVPGKPDDKNLAGAASAIKPDKESPRKEMDRSRSRDRSRDRDAGQQRDSRAQELRLNGDSERSKSSATKPIAKYALSPSDSKKRPLDPEDGTIRPSKKPKPADDLPRKASRPESPRSRDQLSTHDRGKDGRPAASQSTPGSRTALGSARGRDRAVSPRITVNGARNQGSSLPRKSDTSGKHFVPPLLSPLRHPAIDDELETNSPKRRPKEMAYGSKSQTKEKASRTDLVVKKHKSAALELPSLLSPTLPAVVEDELERIEKVGMKGESSQPFEASKSVRKAQTRDAIDEESNPKSLIVTLKIKKAIRPRVKGLLALPSKNRKERSVSMDNTPPPAKKRPRAAEASIEATPAIPAKRAKVTEAATSKVPYTPPNPPASLSQLPSGSSQNHTPRERIAPTPTAGDGPPPSRGGLSKDHLQRRYGAMMALGKNLKRERDKERKAREKERHRQPNGAGLQREQLSSDDLRPIMLSMEMILAYFIAFRSGNQASELSRTHVDEQLWVSLEAHLKELRSMTYPSLPLFTLATQLNGILTNEILRVYSMQGPAKMDESRAGKLMGFLSGQFTIWPEAEKLRGKLTEERLKTPVMGPWTSVYKAAADTLVVMGRIAEREHINWRAEVVPPKDA